VCKYLEHAGAMISNDALYLHLPGKNTCIKLLEVFYTGEPHIRITNPTMLSEFQYRVLEIESN